MRLLPLRSFVVVFILAFVSASCAAATRSQILLNASWKFSAADDPAAAKAQYNDAGWVEATLPHT